MNSKIGEKPLIAKELDDYLIDKKYDIEIK